jgi:hypothetical protein
MTVVAISASIAGWKTPNLNNSSRAIGTIARRPASSRCRMTKRASRRAGSATYSSRRLSANSARTDNRHGAECAAANAIVVNVDVSWCEAGRPLRVAQPPTDGIVKLLTSTLGGPLGQDMAPHIIAGAGGKAATFGALAFRLTHASWVLRKQAV